VSEDRGDHFGVGDERDDAAATGTSAALGHVDLMHPPKKLGKGKVAKPLGRVGRSAKTAGGLETGGVGRQRGGSARRPPEPAGASSLGRDRRERAWPVTRRRWRALGAKTPW